ncbi:MAG: DNA primase regulatory subunit PriL [Halobacteriaceae archaeon]
MDPFHARYPFLTAAREAVAAAEVDLAEVVDSEPAVVDRAVERVELAIEEGVVGDGVRDPRVELLSYPVARVLVSIVDEHVLTRKYGAAEARTAHDRFMDAIQDDSELRSVDRERLTLGRLLREFDLENDVHETTEGFSVDVPAYLLLSAGIRGDEWRLVNRPLRNGRVPVERTELGRLLQAAVEDRVTSALPLSVPGAVAEPLESAVTEVRSVLEDLDLTTDIDAVVPELFPPCMQHLLQQVRDGEHLEHHSRFAITSFLTTIGLTTDEIIEIYSVNPGFGEEVTRYQTDHIRGDTGPTEYTPPSCATMKSYGDCHNPDALCEHISHPLSYYEAKLDDEDEDDLEDWRDRQRAESQ